MGSGSGAKRFRNECKNSVLCNHFMKKLLFIVTTSIIKISFNFNGQSFYRQITTTLT